MVRKLRYHEKKLLKKVNFYKWESDNPNEARVVRKYQLQNRNEYTSYIKIVAAVRRHECQDVLTDRLFEAGIIPNRTLSECEKLSVSSICKRRLSVMLIKLKMAQRVNEATKLIQHGHIRIGPQIINDPAFLVTRANQDFITWTDTSKIRRHVLEYNECLDDFDIEN